MASLFVWLAGALGASRPAVWLIGHVVAPAQRSLYRRSRGRLPFLSAERLLLLTVPGRRSGVPRTTPLFYVRDGPRIVVCNVRPSGERPNPWVRNLQQAGVARIEVGPDVSEVCAREADSEEVHRYWPEFVRMWPAYERHLAASGQRTLFILETASG